MERSSVGLASCDRFPLTWTEWLARSVHDGGLLSGHVAPFLEETIEVPMRVRSSSSLRIANCCPLPCLPQGLRTRVVMAFSQGFRLRRSGRLVDSGSSEQESAQSVRSFLSLHHILAFVRSELESSLVPSLTAALLG